VSAKTFSSLNIEHEFMTNWKIRRNRDREITKRHTEGKRWQIAI